MEVGSSKGNENEDECAAQKVRLSRRSQFGCAVGGCSFGSMSTPGTSSSRTEADSRPQTNTRWGGLVCASSRAIGVAIELDANVRDKHNEREGQEEIRKIPCDVEGRRECIRRREEVSRQDMSFVVVSCAEHANIDYCQRQIGLPGIAPVRRESAEGAMRDEVEKCAVPEQFTYAPGICADGRPRLSGMDVQDVRNDDSHEEDEEVSQQDAAENTLCACHGAIEHAVRPAYAPPPGH